MPIVPTPASDNQPIQQAAMPNVQFNVNAPAEAFGAGQSTQNAQAASLGLMKTAIDVGQQARQRADEVAGIQADTAASKLQTDIQVKISKMKGQDAFAAPEYADKTWNDGVDEIKQGLNGNNQQMMFDKISSSRYMELNKSVQMHVAQQGEAFDDQTTQSGIDQARTAAVVNSGDNQRVQSELQNTQELVSGWAVRKGIPEDSPIFKNKLTQEISATHRDVIQAKLESGLDDDASDYFKEHKTEMTAADVLHADGAIENSEVSSKATDVFNDIRADKSMIFADGTMNLEKVRQKIMNEQPGDDEDATDLSDKRKLKVLTLVKAMGKEFNVDRYHAMAEHERSFVNEVSQDRKANVPLTEALLSVGKYAIDSHDADLKTAFIQSTYAPPKDSDVQAHEALHEGIQNGTASLDDVDRAFYKNHEINATDWQNLRQLKMKTETDGTDPIAKINNKRIEDLAVSTFGKDKSKIDDFMYVLHTQGAGKNPQELWAMAQDEVKKVPPTGGSWYNSDVPKSVNDATQLKAKDTVVGAMENDIGYGPVQAISSGANPQNRFKKTADPTSDVQAFAGALGMKYSDLKAGQPANSAIQSLMNKGKQVTPDAVRKVLDKYPDGNWK